MPAVKSLLPASLASSAALRCAGETCVWFGRNAMGQSGNSSGAIARAAPIVRRHMLDRNSGGEAAGIFSDTKRTAGQRRSVFAPTFGTEGKAALTLALVFFLLFFFAGMVRVCRCVSSALREARSGDDGGHCRQKKSTFLFCRAPQSLRFFVP